MSVIKNYTQNIPTAGLHDKHKMAEAVGEVTALIYALEADRWVAQRTSEKAAEEVKAYDVLQSGYMVALTRKSECDYEVRRYGLLIEQAQRTKRKLLDALGQES